MQSIYRQSAAAASAAPRGCTNFKLRQVARLATRHYESFVAPVGLKITQYSLLTHVDRLGPLRAGELAVAMGLSASALSRNLQPLVSAGWVELTPGEDARSRMVSITAAGRAQRQLAQRAWKQAQLAFNQRLGAERVAALHVLLDECVQALGDDAEDSDDD